jgi:hypothetical protein
MQQVPLVSRQTLLNNKVDLRSSDFVVSQVMTQEAAAPQRGELLAVSVLTGSDATSGLAPVACRQGQRPQSFIRLTSPTAPYPSHRPPGPTMDGKSNAIRGRIVSVKNTKKITEAMRLVAAAKVRSVSQGPRGKCGQAGGRQAVSN